MKAFVLALLVCATAVAGDKPKAPLPPLSPALTSAKTVMLHGEQGAVDKAFGELRKWGRFEIVAEKTKADLVFDFVYAAEANAGHTMHKETLVIYDAKSGDSVYQDSGTHVWPGSMAQAMVKTLRKRLEQH